MRLSNDVVLRQVFARGTAEQRVQQFNGQQLAANKCAPSGRIASRANMPSGTVVKSTQVFIPKRFKTRHDWLAP